VGDLAEKHPTLWWLVYQADYRMRSEMWERIRLEIELKRSALSSIDPVVAQTLVPFDMLTPWDSVCTASVGKDYADFWTSEVTDKAVAMQTHQLTTLAARAPDIAVTLKHTEEARDMPWQRGDKRKGTHQQAVGSPNAAKHPKGGTAVSSSTSFCEGFNASSGCPTEADCPQKLPHRCSRCKMKSHGLVGCWIEHPELRPAGSKGKKGGKKGK
jgi:hypothetical protein